MKRGVTGEFGGERIDHDGRVFIVRITPAGNTALYERVLFYPGKPWAAYRSVSRYHSGQGRRPGRYYQKVLDLAVSLKR